MRKTATVVMSMGIALLMIASATSEAARNPTKPEKKGIAKALEREGFDCRFVSGSCHRKIKVSTKKETWAAAYISGSAYSRLRRASIASTTAGTSIRSVTAAAAASPTRSERTSSWPATRRLVFGLA